MASVVINQVAPNFSLMDYKGERFTLTDYKDKKNILLVLNRGFV